MTVGCHRQCETIRWVVGLEVEKRARALADRSFFRIDLSSPRPPVQRPQQGHQGNRLGHTRNGTLAEILRFHERLPASVGIIQVPAPDFCWFDETLIEILHTRISLRQVLLFGIQRISFAECRRPRFAEKPGRHKNESKLINPANKRKYSIIVVGSGLAGGSAAASLSELGYRRRRQQQPATTAARPIRLRRKAVSMPPRTTNERGRDVHSCSTTLFGRHRRSHRGSEEPLQNVQYGASSTSEGPRRPIRARMSGGLLGREHRVRGRWCTGHGRVLRLGRPDSATQTATCLPGVVQGNRQRWSGNVSPHRDDGSRRCRRPCKGHHSS